jgi:GNAT superfamily N-acetyltransferase
MIVRRAIPDDAKAIYDIGINSQAFRVSDEVPFYEFDEVVAWLHSPMDNLFIVAEQGESLTGFLFCKVMSIHWALLDNFFVVPSARGMGTGTALLGSLKQILMEREIKYLSALFREQEGDTLSFFQQRGFRRQQKYSWMDVFLET